MFLSLGMRGLNVKVLSSEVRRRVLEKVKEKLGYNKTVEVLGISKGSLHNYLHGIRSIPDEVVQKALQYLNLTESEFREAVQGVELLKATGVVKEGGVIDYTLAREGSTIMTNTTKCGIKIAFSATPLPLDGRVAVVTDNNLHVLDENLGAVETTRIARGTEVLAATQGRVAADATNIYIAMTQILTDEDWGWRIIAVNPRPARRFGIFRR
jgi:transcriptional regulator with XRE-family HTH domain